VPPAIADTTNHIRNGLSGGFFSSLLELKASLLWQNVRRTATMLCRDEDNEDEVRQKAQELGWVEHPGKRSSVRVVR
jgi:hypothetical protein